MQMAGRAALAAAIALCCMAAPVQAEPVTLSVLFLGAELGFAGTIAETVLLAVAPYVVGGALLLGSSLVTKALMRAANASSDTSGSASNISESQTTFKQTVAGRKRHYGRVKIGGILAFYTARDGTLYTLIMLAQGEIASFEEHWLNSTEVTLDTAGYVTDDQYNATGAEVAPPEIATTKTPRVQIVGQLGTDGQTAHPVLLTAFPDIWTSDHRLRGVANVLLALRTVPSDSWSDVYPQGAPSYRAVIHGAKVYDPRDAAQSSSDKTTWAWSDNAALCILDYLTHADGMGRARTLFDEASFAAAANVCDQPIQVKAGGTEARYRLNGTYALDDKPSDVLAKMLAVCDGQIVRNHTDGTYGLKVGVWEGTNVTLTDDDILSFEMAQGSDALAAFNQLKITYCSPDHDDQDTEGQAWEDEDNIALTGEIRTDDLTLSYCQSHSQARRIAKIAMHKGNPDWKGTVRTNLAGGLRSIGQRVVRLQIDELSIDETFQVEQLSIAADLSYCDMTVTSLSEDAYDWDYLTEEGDPSVPANPVEAEAAARTPKNFTTTSAWNPGGDPEQYASSTWDVVGGGYYYELQYRFYTHDNWYQVNLLPEATSYDGPTLYSGYSYYLRIRSKSPFTGLVSDWSQIETASFVNH